MGRILTGVLNAGLLLSLLFALYEVVRRFDKAIEEEHFRVWEAEI